MWAVDFVGPINPPGKRTSARYIITVIGCLTRWADETPLKDCTVATSGRFLFKNVVIQFGCPNILMSDQGTHFVNQIIRVMTKEFHIQHKISTPYHPQENRAFEALNKILENALTKV